MNAYLSRCSGVLRTHGLPLILFVLLALLIEAPLFAFPYIAGDAYRGINIPHYGTDQHYYLVRANEAFAGQGFGNPFLSIAKDRPDPTVSSVDRALAAPIRVLGLQERVDVVSYYNILNFVGIVATLLAMYAFALQLSGSRTLAVAAALFAVGGYSILYNKTLFFTDFNIYGRSLYPYASSLPFFVFLFAVYRAVVGKMHYGYAVLAGVLFGVLWHDYFYAWSYSLALLGALFLIYALLRDWAALKRVVFVSLSGIVLGAPAAYSIVSQHLIGDGQITYFYFTANSHAFVWSMVGFATALLLVAYAGVRRADHDTPFFLGLIAAGWIALNQQVLTGRELNHGHYYWYFVVPVAIILASVMLWRLFEAQRWYSPRQLQLCFAGLLIALAFVNTIGGQYRSFPTTLDEKRHEQLYAPVLDRLGALPRGVVFADPGGGPYSYLVTIYTPHDLYFARGALVYYMPLERITDTLLLSLYLNSESRRDPRAFLERELAVGNDNAYTQLFGDLEGYRSGIDVRTHAALMRAPTEALRKVRAELLGDIERDYLRSFPTARSVREKLLQDDVSYLVWDKTIHPTWDPSVIPGTRVIGDNGPIVLYELR